MEYSEQEFGVTAALKRFARIKSKLHEWRELRDSNENTNWTYSLKSSNLDEWRHLPKSNEKTDWNYSLNSCDLSLHAGLDKSVKANEAVMKCLRNMSARNGNTIKALIIATDLTKFLKEAHDAIMAVIPRLNKSDLTTAIQVISLLHRRYKGFSAKLIVNLLKMSIGSGSKAIHSFNSADLREQNRFLLVLVKMFMAGIFTNAGLLVRVLQRCISNITLEVHGAEPLFNLVSDFMLCAGSELLNASPLGVVNFELTHDPTSSPAIRILSDLAATDWTLGCMQQADVRNLKCILSDAVRTLGPHILSAVENFIESRGARALCERLAALWAAADVLETKLPGMFDRFCRLRMLVVFGTEGGGGAEPPGRLDCEHGPFEDERTRQFYQVTPSDPRESRDGRGINSPSLGFEIRACGPCLSKRTLYRCPNQAVADRGSGWSPSTGARRWAEE
jgi:hypothetical protein